MLGVKMNIRELHTIYRENMYIEEFNFVDTMLANYFTTQLEGEPLWNFPIAPSSYGKTELMRPLMKLSKIKNMVHGDNINPYGIIMIDQANANAFSSGVRDKIDIGSKLQDRKTFILIPDLASIMSAKPEESASLFALWRTLYDGYISKHTGTNNKIYDNIHVNVFACSTPIIRNNLEFSAQMGTRELLYEINKVKNVEGMVDNVVTEEGRENMYQGVKQFIDERKNLEFVELNDKEKTFIKRASHYISGWRAVGDVDRDGYLTSGLDKEYPPRLYKQLSKLWIGLKTLGLEFIEIRDIVIEINNGVGDRLRRKVFEALYDKDEYGMKTPAQKNRKEIAAELNRSPNTIMAQLMILRELKLIEPMGSEVFRSETLWTTNAKNLETGI